MSAMPRRTTRSRCERRIDVCMREAPSYCEAKHEKPLKRVWRALFARRAFESKLAYRHALEEAHVKVNFVPGDSDALNFHPGKGNGSLPVLWTRKDEIVESVAEMDVLAKVSVGKVVSRRVMLREVVQFLGLSRLAKEKLEGVEDVVLAGGECRDLVVWLKRLLLVRWVTDSNSAFCHTWVGDRCVGSSGCSRKAVRCSRGDCSYYNSGGFAHDSVLGMRGTNKAAGYQMRDIEVKQAHGLGKKGREGLWLVAVNVGKRWVTRLR